MSLLIFQGCKDFLNQAPTSEETEEYIFKDYQRSLRYIDRLYYNLPGVWTGANAYNSSDVPRVKFTISNPGFLESATDMAEYTASYGAANNSFNVGNWTHSSATGEISYPWTKSYSNLRRCYMFLSHIDDFNNEPTGRKITMKGEVEFMIAFNYFELLKRYGGVPLVKEVLSLDSDFQIPRATYDQTKDYIIENLESAVSVLPDDWGPTDYGRVTKTAAMALKSRVLLYAASPLNNSSNDENQWKEAAEAARSLIDYCNETGIHKLYHDYQNLFMRGYPEDRSEIIMSTPFGNNFVTFKSHMINYGQASPGEGFQGYGSNAPTQNFVDRFEIIKYDNHGNAIGTEKFDWNNPEHVKNIYKNRDPRFYYTVLYNDVYWINRKIETWRDGSIYGKDRNPKDHLFTRTGYYLRKFWPKECRGYAVPGSSNVSAFYIRYAEILLNYAEAMNEIYGPDVDGLGRSTILTARDAINMIRARLVCPSDENIAGENDPYFTVAEERKANPDFPVLPNGMPPIEEGLSKEEMRERIMNERIIELCFEDHYFYDILRWKKGKEWIGGTIYGVDPVKNGDDFNYSRVKVEDRQFDESRMYRYPIPYKQVYIMGIEQNPGW